jgi:hypothetical protein
MAEVVHRYIGRDNAPDESERAKLDAEWKRKRIAAESVPYNRLRCGEPPDHEALTWSRSLSSVDTSRAQVG